MSDNSNNNQSTVTPVAFGANLVLCDVDATKEEIFSDELEDGLAEAAALIHVNTSERWLRGVLAGRQQAGP